MESPRRILGQEIRSARPGDPDDLLERLLDVVASRGLTLYPAQEEAILEVLSGQHVLLNTPTGSGKSLVATAMVFRTLVEGGRAFYTCPIKALVSEKFFDLCDELGAENVGMMTGDASINRDAPVICCTAEILANMALREGDQTPADAVIMDEFHYYADRDRGMAWQIPLLTLSHSTFLLMSATFGDPAPFARRIEELTGRPAAIVTSRDRPVPLHFEYSEIPLHELAQRLIDQKRYPAYVVGFTQRSAAELAQNLMSANFSNKEEKALIHAALDGVRFDSPYGKQLQKLVRHGLGLHHAGLLPKYRLLVEKLSQRGLLKIICGTDTLGVGVNIPIRTVLFTKLCKYDGEKVAILSARDFHQIAGRAGRKGFDEDGFVIAQAPDHAIENIKIDQKKAQDPKRYKKLVRQKPPTKGYVHWDRKTFERLEKAEPEPLTSQFAVSHGMLINLLGNPNAGSRGGYGLLIDLLGRAHLAGRERRIQKRLAKTLFRSLLEAEIIEVVPRESGRGKRVVMAEELQLDFSLHQTLSLYLLETLPLLDPEAETHALDVVSLVESILENPQAILAQQLSRKKGELVNKLKAEGVEYDERMEALERVEIDKPNADFIYETFNAFAERHPWVGQENVRPKSIVREMFESFRTFDEVIREFDLHRVEGILLRYLTDAYNTMVQSVPDSYKTEGVHEIISFLRQEVRGVDSSLLDEWESLVSGRPSRESKRVVKDARTNAEILADDPRALSIRVRREMWRLLRALAVKDWEEALAALGPSSPGAASPPAAGEVWTPERLAAAMEPFFAAHGQLVVTPEARRTDLTHLKQIGPMQWSVWQTLLDPAGEADWSLEVMVDLTQPVADDEPIIVLEAIRG